MSLPYHEPEIVTILVQSSFLLLLNLINSLLDKVLYCGLIGQIFLGIAWGAPGGQWLELNVEKTVVQFGYLGLLLLVYEGGLSTSLKSLRANVWLSIAVAITGIGAPLGLSFVLQELINATPIQCFAAGASLCSTSLGTTFTVLGTSGLMKSRLGVVLTSAAMMDDVVGLVLVQVISNLGQTGGSITAITIIRPLLVSVAFVAVSPLICVAVAKPITKWFNGVRRHHQAGLVQKTLRTTGAAFLIHTLILLGYVTAASYAGTSMLFAAYIAGASISWWDSEVEHVTDSLENKTVPAATVGDNNTSVLTENEALPDVSSSGRTSSGMQIYDRYYSPAVNRILKPLFFASIGFSIPISKMFRADIVWKGLVYALLMAIAKLVCGVWLLRLSMRLPFTPKTRRLFRNLINSGAKLICAGKPEEKAVELSTRTREDVTRNTTSEPMVRPVRIASESLPDTPPAEEVTTSHHQQRTVPDPSKPRSVYPASIIGCAMAARGEIGFLISSIAESNGVFSTGRGQSETPDMFLIVTWAIVLCTILGPLAVGVLVQRVKKLQRGAEKQRVAVHRDVLGVWGVS